MPPNNSFSHSFVKHPSLRQNDIEFLCKKAERVTGRLKGRKVAVAVSGGKDSLTACMILAHAGILFDVVHLDLGIPKFSENSRMVVEQFCALHKLNMKLISVTDYAGATVPEYEHVSKIMYRKPKPCAVCGVFKRYILNRWAWENGYDCIVTGHNLDDAAATLVMNIQSQDIVQMMRVASFIEKDKERKLVARAKPLFYVREQDIRDFASQSGITVVTEKCMYSCDVHQGRIKQGIAAMEAHEQNFAQALVLYFKKIKKHIQEYEQEEVVPCSKCGFPTVKGAGMCKFCRIVEKKNAQQ